MIDVLIVGAVFTLPLVMPFVGFVIILAHLGAPIEPPAPAPVEVAEEGPPKPKRKGWWSLGR
jgi:hypothetical protein